MSYKLVKTHPVAKFYYKGSHSHPVRRTILIIFDNENIIRGYELREGSTVRQPADAPVKSYTKSKIAKMNQLRKKVSSTRSTYRRLRLYDLLFTGP